MVLHWPCLSDPYSTLPFTVYLPTPFVTDVAPFHSSLLHDRSVWRHSETTLLLSILSFRFILDELVSSDVAQELQLLFSDTAPLVQSNPSILRKMKAHLEQFPSLAEFQCPILTWFDSTFAFHFRFIAETLSCFKRVVWCPTGIQ